MLVSGVRAVHLCSGAARLSAPSHPDRHDLSYLIAKMILVTYKSDAHPIEGFVLKIGVLIQYGKHPVVDDAESRAEEYYQPANIDMPCICAERPQCCPDVAAEALALVRAR